jgi:uncharacterized protein (UPF0276 family)
MPAARQVIEPMRSEADAKACLAGIGLKSEHLRELLAGPSPAAAGGVDFLEVHAENYMVDGGPMLGRLEAVRACWPLSVHGVGLSIGVDGRLDADHLDRLDALLRRFEPDWFSEHLAWSSHGGGWFNDLLPLPYDTATLHRVCDHVDQAQERLGRRMLLENPATYVEYASSTMDEGGFLAEVVKRTGCGLLLDVNNAYVSGVNHGRDPWTTIEALPPRAIAEIHLAGFAEERVGAGERLLIDHHGASVDEAVWALYARAVDRLGPLPTLIERDNHLPPLEALLSEARRAVTVQRACLDRADAPEVGRRAATLTGVA